MNHVVAAVDHSSACAGVLAVTRAFAARVGADVVAIHVHEGPARAAHAQAAAANVRLREVEGPVVDELCAASLEPDVVAMVIGARSFPGGARPAGHIALALISALTVPVVVVPPTVGPSYALRRLLVPVEVGAHEACTRTQVGLAWSGALDVVVLHVHESHAMPRFGDQPQHEEPAFRAELMARSGPPGHRDRTTVETRVGIAGEAILEVADEVHADMIVLAWSQDLSPGKAEVVRSVLARSVRPLLLFPCRLDEARARTPLPTEREGEESLPGVRM